MGTFGNEPRGKTKNGRKPSPGRLSAAIGGGDGQQSMVHWSEADPAGIVALTQVVSALGGAVTFGGSRDQGALQIAIFLDGEKVVRWCDSPDAANDALAELWEALDKLR